jgi:small subunit ribosomal protein S4e
MARGPKKHLKKINAPKHWMLAKLGGTWAPRPSTGPHKLRECLPLVILLRNRLKYALTYREAMMIVKDPEGLVKVDGKARADPKFPVGFMDVISIPNTGDFFRLSYDVKGRFALQRIEAKDAVWKLLRVKNRVLGPNKVPYIVTHDGRTIRYPHPDVEINDTIKYNLETAEIQEFLKFEPGQTAMITGGNNIGRVGVIAHFERHDGGFSICHMRDSKGHSFATRISNVMVLGKGKKLMVELPKERGIRISIIEEREAKMGLKH